MASQSLTCCFVVCFGFATLAHAQSDAPQPTLVYSHEFERGKAVGKEWSKTILGETPKGNRVFLGTFGREEVRLSVPELSEHRFVILSFDLYLIQSWDGSVGYGWGPDVWDLRVPDGPTLLHTTFSNCGFFSDNNEQAFPDNFPCPSHPAFTGSFEKQTLGYTRNFGGGPERTFKIDSVYRLELMFPHTDKALTFVFNKLSTEEAATEEGWGLQNVKVAVTNQPREIDEKTFDALWGDLARTDDEGKQAFAATWDLIAGGEQTLTHCRNRLSLQAGPNLAKLLEKLSGTEAERVEAERQLSAGSPWVIPNLQQLVDKNPDTELVARAKKLIELLSDPQRADGESLRRQRFGHVLQVVHSPTALAMRKALGYGDP